MAKLLQKLLFITSIMQVGISSAIPFSMENLLQAGKLLSFEAAQVDITDGNGSTLNFFQVYFYSDTLCETSGNTDLMTNGVASFLNAGIGFSMQSPQLLNINESSLYQLAFNRGFTTTDMSNIQCIGVSMTGGNSSTSGINCSYFTDVTCDNTTHQCTSNASNSVSWVSSPTACVTKYVYISNNTGLNVYKCAINSDSTLDTCALTGPSSAAFTLGNVVNNGYAYFASGTSNAAIVQMCTLNPANAGTLTSASCASLGTLAAAAKGIAFNGIFAYIAGSAGITQCNVTTAQSNNGLLTGCALLALAGGSVSFSAPISLVINNGYFYITNNSNSSISICQITAGKLSCPPLSVVTTHVSSPKGIAINNGYIYFVNSSVNSTDGAVASCQIQNNGANLGNCVNTGASTSDFSTPQGIAIYNDYAYITNNGGSGVYPKSSITKCQISSPGQLSDCRQVARTTTFSTPTGISIY